MDASCDGIILKSGEMLTRNDVASVMYGKRMVFNQPILAKKVERFKEIQEDKKNEWLREKERERARRGY